jgi:MHS family proline/betaine transporter-like MFS transporter
MDNARTRRVIAAGMIGNVLEWYDFAIYGYFASQIGRQFFPHEDAVAQLLAAFGVFALGYLMRPVGGALIGHIGDRLGRRAALTFSVAAMAIPTFLIGLLPTYAAIGIAAPIALTLLRMVQGLSVGGEYTSSMVFLVEHAPHGRRGLMGAFISCGACAGILLGSAIGAGFAANMSTAALDAWGWRIPFLLGLVVGIAGYFLRRHVVETVPAERRERPPIIETLHDHWRLVLGLAGLSVFNAVGFYVSFVYLVSWLQTADGIPPARALEINSISMLMLLPVMIVTGLLNDRFGRKPFLLLACARLRLRGAAVLAPAPALGALRPARTAGAGPDHRNLLRHAAHHHGGGGAAAGSLHGGGARLQYLPGRDRRGHATGRDLAGRAHPKRARAGVPDHGGGGGDLRHRAAVPRDLSRAVRGRAARAGRRPGLTALHRGSGKANT